MLISRQAVVDYLRRPFDNFAWMKSLSRKAVLAELCALRVQPYFKTEPWLHQLVCHLIGCTYPEFLFLLDMGLGKSKIVLDLITQAQRERTLGKALVTVPRLINIDSWTEDTIRHSDLEPWGIGCEDIEEKWERLACPGGDVVFIDYQGLHLALCERRRTAGKKKLVIDKKKMAHVQTVYNFVNMDESHKLGNHQSLWWALMRRITAASPRVYASTGTLFGRDLEPIWSQYHLVDGGKTFGENLGLFRASFFHSEPNKFGRGEKYTYDRRMDTKLHAMIGHRSLRYDEDEVSDLPKLVAAVERFHMTDEQVQHYGNALQGFISAGGDPVECKAQWITMRRIVSGYMHWTDDSGPHTVRFARNPKLEWLDWFVDSIGTRNKVVVCYDYTETGRMICDMLAAAGVGFEWFYGGTKDHSASRRRFMEDKDCRVFVMNSEAGGTGNDGLQKVCRYMVMYETPTPPTTRKQTIKRVHRPGQGLRSFLYDLVMQRSLDAGILADIAANHDTYDSVVNGRQPRGKGFFLQDWQDGDTTPA